MNSCRSIAAVFAFALLSAPAFAVVNGENFNSSGGLGVGIELGQPIGVTGKYWLSNIGAVDGALGYHFNGNFDMHADYLLHTYVLSGGPHGSLPLYAGLGGRVLAGNDTQFGLRIPLGISYLYLPERLELFAEIAPVVDLTDIGADIDGVVGLRLYTF